MHSTKGEQLGWGQLSAGKIVLAVSTAGNFIDLHIEQLPGVRSR